MGPLGIRVDNDDDSNKNSCIVCEVKKGSQGHRMGIQVNDIICHEEKQIMEEQPFQEASLKEVLRWASSTKRPVQFVVKRRLIPNNDNNNRRKMKGTETTDRKSTRLNSSHP